MTGIIVITTVAFVLGILLFIVDYLFNKKEKNIDELEQMLPGINCGACGYGGCNGLATAIIKEGEDISKCRPLRDEQKKKIEEYLKK